MPARAGAVRGEVTLGFCTEPGFGEHALANSESILHVAESLSTAGLPCREAQPEAAACVCSLPFRPVPGRKPPTVTILLSLSAVKPSYYLILFVCLLHLVNTPARGGWVAEAILSAPVPQEGDRFGVDLLMEGNTLIAGEQSLDYGPTPGIGGVVSFERNGAGEWVQTQHLTYLGEPAQSLIGRRIALSGNTLLITAMTPTAGRVLVYNRSAPGAQWVSGPTLTGDTQTEYFGNSVALEGDTAVVGADNADATQIVGRGAVYVFTRSGGTWRRSQRIPAPPEAMDYALFGSGVALSGEWLAVNARNDGPYRGGIRGTAGATYLYRRTGGTWTLHRKLVPDPEVALETGWESTALKNGVLVIGASRGENPVSPFTYGGAAYIYTLDTGTGTWSATPQKLPATALADGAGFGEDVTVEGNRMAIGASTIENRGRVYTYTRNAGGLWVEDGSFTRSDLTGTPFFGERVVLNQGRLAVAAGASGTSSATGRAFVYAEGVALEATTGDSYAVGATNASLLGTVLSEEAAVPVTFEFGLTTSYGSTLSATPPTVQTSGSAQQVYLSMALLLPQTTYHYRVRAGTAAGADRTFTTGAVSATLADAVDAPQLNWDTYSAIAGWQRQTVTSFDGSDAARSGAIPHGQSTSVQTLIMGPGTISFRWKVSSELNHDFLQLYVNGSLQGSISGETAWEQKIFNVPAGRYLFTWFYGKDQSGVAGSDAAWLDTVVWTPTSGVAAWNQWRTAQFTAAQLNDAGISGPGADPDRDGLTNLEEAFFGTPPSSATPARLSPARMGDALYVSWQEPLGDHGITAVPEWSPNGQTWLTSGQSAPGISARTITVTLGSGSGTHPVTARLDATGQPRAMLRLRCSVIP